MTKRTAILVAIAVTAGACTDPQAAPTDLPEEPSILADNQNSGGAAGAVAGENIVDAVNALLEAQNSEYRVEYAEYYTDPASGAAGNIIVANDRGNKRLGLDFIPDDSRRGGADGDPNTIDFFVDLVDGATASGLSAVTTTNAIARAMNTWDARACSNLGVNVVPVPVDLGLVQAILGFGGGLVGSDVMHAGWLPGAFFDLLQPNGSASILGITFTLTFAGGDLDGNGLSDLAAREIYYNDNFAWSDAGTTVFDVESVALHEAGHGLSQGHFGKIFIKKNGSVRFSPRAVMNAAYSGPQRALSGTDIGGHCGLWGSWPQN